MTKHIVYVVQLPLTVRDRRRYGVDYLLGRGYQISILDVGPWMVPGIPVNRDHYAAFTDLNMAVAGNLPALRKQIAALAGADMAVCTIAGRHLSARAWPVLRLLRQAAIPYLILQNSAIPMQQADAAPRRTLARLAHMQLLNSVVYRLPLPVLGIDPAAITVLGGRRSAQGGRLVGADTIAVAAHSGDYDQVLELRAQAAPPVRPVAVFLDQFLPFHPDVIQDKAKPIAPEPYYASLVRLFTRVEQELGLEVEIAVHPRADYHQRSEDWFQGRRLVYGDTAAMVRSSSLVLAHYSTSISFAVAFAKPVLLMSSRAIMQSLPIRERMAQGYASALRRPIADLDDVAAIKLDHALDVDAESYGRYVDDYLKAPGSPDLPLWEIIADHLDLGGLRRME